LLPMYLNRFAPFYQPSFTERFFILKLGEIPVHCIIDTVGHLHLPFMANPKPSVVDYKTVGKKQSQATLDSDVQLSAYAMVAQKELKIKHPEVGYCDLLKTKTPNVQFFSATITPQRLRWFEELTFDVANTISKGCFPLTKPDNWICSKKFCGFWHLCRGKNKMKKKVFRGK